MITFKELKENKILGRFVIRNAYNWNETTLEYLLQAGYKNYFKILNNTVYSVDHSIRTATLRKDFPILTFPDSITKDQKMEYYEELMWIMDTNIMITSDYDDDADDFTYSTILEGSKSIEKNLKTQHNTYLSGSHFSIANNNNIIKKFISNRDILKSLEVNKPSWFELLQLHNLKDITLFTLQYKKQKREIYDVWSGKNFSSKKSSKDMFSCLDMYDNNIIFVVDLYSFGNRKHPNFFYTRINDENSYSKLIQHINNDNKYLAIMFNYDFFEKIHNALEYNMVGILDEFTNKYTGQYKLSIPLICNRIAEEMYGKEAFTIPLVKNKE